MSEEVDSRIAAYLSNENMSLEAELLLAPDKGLQSPLHNLFSYTLRQREYPSGVPFKGDQGEGFLLGRELILVPKVYEGDDSLPPETKLQKLQEYLGCDNHFFHQSAGTLEDGLHTVPTRYVTKIACLEEEAAIALDYWYPETC